MCCTYYVSHTLFVVQTRSYLETNDWNLEQALQEANEDAAWERQEAERQRQQEAAAAARAKEEASSRKSDPYADIDHEGKDDNECLACFSFLVAAVRSLTRA